MRLFYSLYSPYARKVRVALRELGLLDQVEEVIVDPFQSPANLLTLNPLSKVPALEVDGQGLFDSGVICEYLDQLSGAPRLYPVQPRERTTVLRLHALASGMMDASVASALETRRTERDAGPSRLWLDRWQQSLRRALDTLAEEELPSDIQLDGIAIACALDHISYRLQHLAWRETHPKVKAWFDTYTARLSFQETGLPTA